MHEVAKNRSKPGFDCALVRSTWRQRGDEQPVRAAEVVIRQRRNPMMQGVIAQTHRGDEGASGVGNLHRELAGQS